MRRESSLVGFREGLAQGAMDPDPRLSSSPGEGTNSGAVLGSSIGRDGAILSSESMAFRDGVVGIEIPLRERPSYRASAFFAIGD